MAAKIRIPIEVEINGLKDIPELEDKLSSFGKIAQTATEAARKYTQEDQIRWAQYQRAITAALKGATTAQKEYIDNLKKMASTSAKMTLLDDDGKSTGKTKLTNQAAYQKEINNAIREYGRLMDDVNEKSSDAHRKLVEFWKAFAGKTEMVTKISGEMAGLEEKISLVTAKMIELAESGNTEGKEIDKLNDALLKYQKQLESLEKAAAEDAFKDFNRVVDEQAAYFKSTGRELEGLQKKYQTLNNQILKNIQNGDVEHNEELAASLSDVSARIDELNEDSQKLNFERLQRMSEVMESLGENSEATRIRSRALKDEIIRLSEHAEENRDRIQELTQEYKNLNQTASGIKAWGQNFASLIGYVLKYRIALALVRDTWRKVKETIKESMKVAAEAEQIYNKLNTVFNNYNASLREAIELSGKLGTATSTTASALSTIGDMLQGQGMSTNLSLSYSSEWSKWLADIIAFKDLNMTLDEFSSSFMSGAAGNTRNFRQFGSIVKDVAVEARLAADGLDELEGEELELAKMVTRATLALEQQANSEGAVAREWNTVLSVNRRLSESWKEWKEGLGETINEGLRPFKQLLAEILEYANRIKEVRDAITEERKLTTSFSLDNEEDRANLKQIIPKEKGKDRVSNVDMFGVENLAKGLYSVGASFKDLQTLVEEEGDWFAKTWIKRFNADEINKKLQEFTTYADAPEKFAYAWNDANEAMIDAKTNLDTITGLMKGFGTIDKYISRKDFNDKNSIESILGLTTAGADGNEAAALEDLTGLYQKLQKAISDTTEKQSTMNKTLADMQSAYKDRFGVDYTGATPTTNALGEALSDEEIKAAKDMQQQIYQIAQAIELADLNVELFKGDLEALTPVIANLYSKSLIENVSKIGDEYDDQIASLRLEARIRKQNVNASDEEISLLVSRQNAMDELDATYQSQLATISLLEDNEQALADLELARETAEQNINAYFNERIRLQKEADEAAREQERLDTIKDILESSLEYGDSARENLEILRLEQKTRADNKDLSEDELSIEIERQTALRETENEYDTLLSKLLEQNASQEELDQLETDRTDAIQAQNDLYDYQLQILREETAEMKKQQGMLTVGSIRNEAYGNIQNRRAYNTYMAQEGMTAEKANIYMNRDALLKSGYQGFLDQTSGIAGVSDALKGFNYKEGPDALVQLLTDAFDQMPVELQSAINGFEDMWYMVIEDVTQQVKEIDDEIERVNAEKAAAEATKLVESRMKGAQSWAAFKGGISETEYSGPYAEVEQWVDSMNDAMSTLLAQMFEEGYTVSELNDLRAEGITLIEDEAKARKEAIDAENEAARKSYMKNTAMRAAGSTVVGIMNDAAEGFSQGGIWGAILNVAIGILEKFGVLDELNEMVDDSIRTIVKPLMPMVTAITSATKMIIAPIMKAIETPIKIIATVVTVISGVIEGIATAIDWASDNIMTFFKNLGTIIYNATHWFDQQALDDYRTLEDLATAEMKVVEKTEQNVYKIWHSNEEEKSLDDSYVKAIQEMMSGGILTDLEGMGLISDYLGTGRWSNTLAPVDESGSYMQSYAQGAVDNSTNTYNFQINGSGLSKEEMIEAMIEFYKSIAVTKGTPTTYIGGAFAS